MQTCSGFYVPPWLEAILWCLDHWEWFLALGVAVGVGLYLKKRKT